MTDLSRAERTPTRLLVCGSRTFREDDLLAALFSGLEDDTVVIHGAAKGADSLAGFHARRNGFEVEEYPARWDQDGKAAGPIRNQRMLVEGKPDAVWAFVDKPLLESRGTADMVRRAQKVGLPVFVTQYLAPKENDVEPCPVIVGQAGAGPQRGAFGQFVSCGKPHAVADHEDWMDGDPLTEDDKANRAHAIRVLNNLGIPHSIPDPYDEDGEPHP